MGRKMRPAHPPRRRPAAPLPQEGAACRGSRARRRAHRRRRPRLAGAHDGRVLDVRNVVWCTGFRPDFSWIRVPDRVRRRRLSGAVPGRRRLVTRPLLRGAAVPALVRVDAHHGQRKGFRARCAADPARAHTEAKRKDRRDRGAGVIVSEDLFVWNGSLADLASAKQDASEQELPSGVDPTRLERDRGRGAPYQEPDPATLPQLEAKPSVTIGL